MSVTLGYRIAITFTKWNIISSAALRLYSRSRIRCIRIRHVCLSRFRSRLEWGGRISR